MKHSHNDKGLTVAKKLAPSLLEWDNAPLVIANSLTGIAERHDLPVMERSALLAAVKLIERDILHQEIIEIEIN